MVTMAKPIDCPQKSDRKLKTEDGNPKFCLHANNHESKTEDRNSGTSNVVWLWRSNITKIFYNLVSKWSGFVSRRPKPAKAKPNNQDTNQWGQST